ncbi:50S ribosomal protein L32 [Candidatus Uhrbacteria bacterium]|nr:50S ribosomal protein L32 [Candidatus Uhrbacteria bacterium]
MPLPSFRSSRSKVRRRRSHHALKPIAIGVCKACGAEALAHRACPKCGQYNGRAVKGGMEAVEAKLAKAPKVKKADAEPTDEAPKAE